MKSTAQQNINKALNRISYSRIMLWKRSKKQFYDRYILAKELPMNRHMIEGKKVDDLIDLKRMPKNDKEKNVLLFTGDQLIGGKQWLEAKYRHKDKLYKIVGEIDYFNGITHEITENKNSNSIEGAFIKNALKQLDMYAFIKRLKGEKFARTSYLVLLRKDKDLQLTGVVDTRKHYLSDRRIEKWREYIDTFIAEVHIHYDR